MYALYQWMDMHLGYPLVQCIHSLSHSHYFFMPLHNSFIFIQGRLPPVTNSHMFPCLHPFSKVCFHRDVSVWVHWGRKLLRFSLAFCRAGRFSSLCNMESVSLEPLKKNIDVDFVRELLEEFQQKTGSQVARNILDNWDAEKGKFVKVRHCVKHYWFLWMLQEGVD